MLLPDGFSVFENRLLVETADEVCRRLDGGCSAHDWGHIERVQKIADRIALSEVGADRVVVALAALMHDLYDYKFSKDLDAGPDFAIAWLSSFGFQSERAEAVAEIIRGVSFRGDSTEDVHLSIEGQCVRDADRLDALGAIGIARTFAYGGAVGRPIHDPNIPPQDAQSPEEYYSNLGTSINHFYEKLLRISDRMETNLGRIIAEERKQFLYLFLQQFYNEWCGSDSELVRG